MIEINRENLIKILVAVLIVQIIFVIGLEIFSIQNVKARSIGKKLIKDFNVNSVASFEINDSRNPFSIEKTPSGWFVNTGISKIPGEVIKIDSYLDIIRNLPDGVIRDKGDDPNNIALYGLDSQHAKKITIRSIKSKNILIYIGNPGVVRGSSYIKLNNEKKIREVRSIISSETGIKPIDWARKKIIIDNLTIEDVNKTVIDSSMSWFKGQYSIEYKEAKDQNGNILKDNFVLNPPVSQKLKEYELQNIVSFLISISAADYKLNGNVNQKDKIASINLTLKNKKAYNFFVYAADKDDPEKYIVDDDFDDYLYLVKESDLKKIIKAKFDLVE
jgi:Domain of unknown function (DUF4340)